MIQEVYNISREAMEILQHHLRNPSKKYASKREAMMKRLRSEIHTSYKGSTEISSFDDLDLSFLGDSRTEGKFSYSPVYMLDEGPIWNVPLNDVFSSKIDASFSQKIDISYGNEDITMTAA